MRQRKEVTPPNPKMYAGSLRRMREALKDELPPLSMAYAAWGVIWSVFGGEWASLRHLTRNAIRHTFERWRATLELWYDRNILRKTQADLDREFEELGDLIREMCGAKPLHTAKQDAQKYIADRADVTGVGIGDQRIIVYLKNGEARAGIPESFNGFPVEFIVTGKIQEYAHLPTVGCGVCRGAGHMQNDVTKEIRVCWKCNAGGTVDKSLRPGQRWA